METCQVAGCTRAVSKAGYTFCLDHWKAERNGHVKRCGKCLRWHEATGPAHVCTPPLPEEVYQSDDPAGFLSSSKVGKHFGLSPSRVNLIMAELGWIERYVKGWVPTDQGNALGANVREMRQTGVPFVVWPESILRNAALRASVGEQTGSGPATKPATPEPPPLAGKQVETPKPAIAPRPADPSADFRAKFPPTFRTQDGHMVRSRAEVLIDNWLYVQGLVHAYERRLPIEEECYCDFYLPGGHGGSRGVYIEFWGRESDPRYRDRQTEKRAIYARHGFRLIELNDADIERLDDVLPKLLLRFGIESV